jgi:hypothetical protein
MSVDVRVRLRKSNLWVEDINLIYEWNYEDLLGSFCFSYSYSLFRMSRSRRNRMSVEVRVRLEKSNYWVGDLVRISDFKTEV